MTKSAGITQNVINRENMKSIAIAVVAIPLLAGCAGDQAFIRQTPIITESGQKFYILASDHAPNKWNREYALKNLDQKSNELCPTGFTLMNEETKFMGYVPTSASISAYTVTRQIKCKVDEQPKS